VFVKFNFPKGSGSVSFASNAVEKTFDWIPAPRFREDKLRGNDSRDGAAIPMDTGTPSFP
jgi:hypothetical protein